MRNLNSIDEHKYLEIRSEVVNFVSNCYKDFFDINLNFDFKEKKINFEIALIFPYGWIEAHKIVTDPISIEDIEIYIRTINESGVDVTWWIYKGLNLDLIEEWNTSKYGELYLIDTEKGNENITIEAVIPLFGSEIDYLNLSHKDRYNSRQVKISSTNSPINYNSEDDYQSDINRLVSHVSGANKMKEIYSKYNNENVSDLYEVPDYVSHLHYNLDEKKNDDFAYLYLSKQDKIIYIGDPNKDRIIYFFKSRLPKHLQLILSIYKEADFFEIRHFLSLNPNGRKKLNGCINHARTKKEITKTEKTNKYKLLKDINRKSIRMIYLETGSIKEICKKRFKSWQ